MSKFRIIEVKYPLNWFYHEGVQQEPPKEVGFTTIPKMLLQERKSIFHSWKTVKQIDSILEAEYYIYNQKVEKTKTIERVIGKL